MLNRTQEILKENKLKEKKDKMMNDDMKTLAAKENITIKLRGRSNFFGMDGKYVLHHTEASRKYLRP